MLSVILHLISRNFDVIFSKQIIVNCAFLCLPIFQVSKGESQERILTYIDGHSGKLVKVLVNANFDGFLEMLVIFVKGL